jgi:ankyrin repeat protein
MPEFLTHYAIIGGLSTHLVKLLLHAEPESCRIQDSDGMVPLHHACASNAINVFDYVVALLDAGVEDSLKIQDNQGRTATQLVTQAASITDDNGRLPLHHLASRSNNLTVKALNLLVDAYPDSITLPDKFGMLPCHHACLNKASSLELLMFFINSFAGSLEAF